MIEQQQRILIKAIKTLVALIGGAINVFAFAPFGWWVLTILSTIILFSLWLTTKRRGMAAWYGFVFGLGMFGVGTSWIYVSLHDFGGMSAGLAGFSVLLLVIGVSLLPALAGYIQGYFLQQASKPAPMRLILIMPSVWLLFEWLRGWMFSGYPWLTTGYAMLESPIAAFAPFGGVYLVSLITLMSSGALLALLLNVSSGSFLLSALLAAGWISGGQFSNLSWTHEQGDEISVAIIQNNVPLAEKWDIEKSDSIIEDYFKQSELHRDANLVVWPEAAVPGFLDTMSDKFHEQIRKHPADFIFGILTRQNSEGKQKHFNSIASYMADAKANLYHKQHLVPFGEYLPLRGLFQPLMDRLEIPMSDFSRWRSPQPPLRSAGNRFAASICYEDAFPSIWRDQVSSSGILLNISEDMWFGDSLGPHQRLQMARFRSKESGRPMIRASNNGLSSVINWQGGIDAKAPQFVKTVLTGTVQPRTGITPYTKHGNKPVLILAVILFLLGVFGLWASRDTLREHY